ncbi:MAG TPA: condensation domain-containing protein [Thermoanaerobaculia bacterium]|nr:condensation domain-containing protein [Thermoanaerobaculia bacterium]
MFCLAIHHIACDGWSLGVLIHEVTALYAGSTLPELPVQYADYAAWQRSWLRGELLDEQLGYWQERLAGGGPAAILPTDHPGSRAGGGLELIRREIPRGVLESLVRLGREEGATLFMTLLAALDVLLYRYTGRERVVVGSMHANRGHSAVEGLLGFFVNVLPLQTLVEPGLSFRGLLGRVREAALGAYAHQDAPYEKVVERVRAGASAGRNALFQVMVVFQNMAIPPLRLAGVDVGPFEPGESTKRAAFDLSVTFALDSGQLLTWMEYDTGLYERATVGRLLHHFERVLRDAAAEPARRVSELPLREEDDRQEEGKQDGKLWLTDPSHEEDEEETGPAEPEAIASFAVAQEKAAAIQDQVAARRSKLSDKQLALLRQRLKK